MVQIKYAAGITPYYKQKYGTDFQSSFQGQIMRNMPRIRANRNKLQKKRINFYMTGCRAWQNLTSVQRAAWNSWATTYPQSWKHDASKFLSGYQVFIKRNFYKFLSENDLTSLLLSPTFIAVPDDFFTISFYNTGSVFSATISFSIADSSLNCLLFVSASKGVGKNFSISTGRFVASFNNFNQTIDITNSYISHFGRLPTSGSVVNYKIVKCAINTGSVFVSIPSPIVLPSINPDICKNGYLYNWYSVDDSRLLANDGWHVPSAFEMQTLKIFITSGGSLKETGFIFWNAPNTGATNNSHFFARGAGVRSSAFFELLQTFYLWNSNNYAALLALYSSLSYNSAIFRSSDVPPLPPSYLILQKYFGCSARLLKDSTTLSNGETGLYFGNDGKIYTTICIGAQEFLSVNLQETKFRNQEPIPLITNQSAWSALTTAGYCFYNNDISNV